MLVKELTWGGKIEGGWERSHPLRTIHGGEFVYAYRWVGQREAWDKEDYLWSLFYPNRDIVIGKRRAFYFSDLLTFACAIAELENE